MGKKVLFLPLLILLAVSAFGQDDNVCNNEKTCVTRSGTLTAGQSLKIPNLVAGYGTTFALKFSGSPSGVSIPIRGCTKDGVCDVLETYTATSDSNEAPTVSKVYSYFTVTVDTLSGGTSPTVKVTGTLTIAKANGNGGGVSQSDLTTALAGFLPLSLGGDTTVALGTNTLNLTGAGTVELSDPGSTLEANGQYLFGPPVSSLPAFLQTYLGGTPTKLLTGIMDNNGENVNLLLDAGTGHGGQFWVTAYKNNADTGEVVGVESDTYLDGGLPVSVSRVSGFEAFPDALSTSSAPIGIISGFWSQPFNEGTGSVGILSGFVADGVGNSGTPPAIASGFYAFTVAGVGALNAAFYADDQGSGAADWGSYLAGASKSYVGGTLTINGTKCPSGQHSTLSIDDAGLVTATGCS